MNLFTIRHVHEHHYPDLIGVKTEIARMRDLIIKTKEEIIMATDQQITKLKGDIAKLLDAAVAEIAAAVAAAQKNPDPEIDDLDTRVMTVTDNLTAAAAALRGDAPLPTPVPPPAG